MAFHAQLHDVPLPGAHFRLDVMATIFDREASRKPSRIKRPASPCEQSTPENLIFNQHEL